MHYDNEQSVGIIVNYTYRNFVFSKSRLLVTVDAAERFKARIDYQKFLDNGHRWWLNLEGKMAYMRSNDLTFRWLGAINDSDDENIRFRTTCTETLPGRLQ